MPPLSRRTFLRAAGVSLALPFLEAMRPALAVAAAAPAAPRRFVAVNIPLSFLPANFFPTETGAEYQPSLYLQGAEALRRDFTVFSGLSHPDVDGGHSAAKSFLTAAPHPGARSFRNTISLDQVIAKAVGENTRFASLTLGSHSLSWSANGVGIPAESLPAKTFARLFLEGTPKEIAAQRAELSEGHSILDAVREDAAGMSRRVSAADRDKLDQFFTAVRETETRLNKAQMWSATPKPKVDAKPPAPFEAADLVTCLREYFDVMHLALQTDSTRVISLGGTDYGTVPKIPGVDTGYHGLSHHGRNPELMKQLELVELATMGTFLDFLSKLKQTNEGEANLLDRTQVLFGSNLGNASGHLTTNLPILLAGGSFRHGQHLGFDAVNNYPLPNLFVSMLQGLGLPVEAFASSTGTMRGLELARS